MKLHDLEVLSQQLEANKIIVTAVKQKRMVKPSPVNLLSTRLAAFKHMHHEKEKTLIRQLQKLNLDKYILLKEKLVSAWNDDFYTSEAGPHLIRNDVRRRKRQRD